MTSVTDAAGNTTNYSYNALDDLTQVTQGSQTRTFVYDSLSRLTSATNPESGTTTYSYDANGNLYGKINARGLGTAYGYDALNRLTFVTHSDNYNTPNVQYYYDQTAPWGVTLTNPIGRLT